VGTYLPSYFEAAMSTRRERFFRCRVHAGQDLGEEMVLQAWDADSAAAAFREELARAGLASADEVEVEELTGELPLRGPSRSPSATGPTANA
jgi:hypothetical protein